MWTSAIPLLGLRLPLMVTLVPVKVVVAVEFFVELYLTDPPWSFVAEVRDQVPW